MKKIKSNKYLKKHKVKKVGVSNSDLNNSFTKPTGDNYFIWGKHALGSALNNIERKIIKIYHTAETLQWIEERIKTTPKAIVPLIQVEKNILKNNSQSSPHQGLMAEVKPIDWFNIEDIIYSSKENICLVILDQVTNPQNIGAILRIANAFEANGVIITKKHAPSENGLMARAAAGAIEMMPLIRVTNLSRAIEYLKKENFTVVGLEKNGNVFLNKISDIPRIALVLGSEDQGLRRLTQEKLSLSVKIPIAVGTESLNVASAAAIALYEIYQNKYEY